MKLVLLSGGSGKRLWPMSTDARSKQFLKVLDDPERGKISMIQRVWEQLRTVGIASETYLCASEEQAETIAAQIRDANVIVEPSRRDTFPAVALASLYLGQPHMTSDDEMIAVAPVDHYVDLGFFQAVRELPAVLARSGADIALLGVRPTHPSSQFGYILTDRGHAGPGFLRVHSFVEKPSADDAHRLIAQGALWNCGVFCFRLSFMKEFLREHRHPDNYPDLLSAFGDLPKQSFDYRVLEQTRSIAVREYGGRWKDLGTWNSLSEELHTPFSGLGTQVDCRATHVINELDIPVVAKGLQNVVVVAAPDGILVVDKEHCGDIKNVVNGISAPPRLEERRWGSSVVLDRAERQDGTEVQTMSIRLRPACSIPYQRHFMRHEVWTIIEGMGEMALGGRVFTVSAGDAVQIRAGQWHSVRSEGGLRLIEVRHGTCLREDDMEVRSAGWAEAAVTARMSG